MASSVARLDKSAAEAGTPLRMKYRNSDVSLDEAVEYILDNNIDFELPNGDLLKHVLESTPWEA